MHQPAQRCFITVFAIHIHDMRSVPECFICFQHAPFHSIQRKSFFEDVPFCDKDHIGFRQFFEILACQQKVRIHDAAVVACAFAASTLIFSLYFDVHLPAAVIYRKDIQPHRASLQVLNGMLCLRRYDLQIIPVHYDVQDQFHAFCAALHTLVEKIVIHEPQLLDFIQIIPAPAFCYFHRIQISTPLSLSTDLSSLLL